MEENENMVVIEEEKKGVIERIRDAGKWIYDRRWKILKYAVLGAGTGAAFYLGSRLVGASSNVEPLLDEASETTELPVDSTDVVVEE